MRITHHLALLALPAALLAGCASQSMHTLPSEFDSAGLNAHWYGAYHRPLPSAEPHTAAQRPEPAPARSQSSPAASAAQPATRPPARNAINEGNDPATLAAAYIQAVYELNETRVHRGDGRPSIVDIYRHAQAEGTVYHTPRPAVGDLVFFHNTYDRNGDGRNNDWYSHIGLVEHVDSHGTVHFLSFRDGEVRSDRLTPGQPDVERADGRLLNTPLRARQAGDSPHTQYLAGELFAGFATLLGEREEVFVLDDWTPSSEDLHASR